MPGLGPDEKPTGGQDCLRIDFGTTVGLHKHNKPHQSLESLVSAW